jgi:hypothetical protein
LHNNVTSVTIGLVLNIRVRILGTKQEGIKEKSYFETNQDECRVNFEKWFGDDCAAHIHERMQDLAKVWG